MVYSHTPVMPEEVVSHLNLPSGGFCIDATVGLGGHAERILSAVSTVRLLAIDRDEAALRSSRERLDPFGSRVELVQGPFSQIKGIATERGICEADGILFDLGVSSMQLDDPSRGFSHRFDGPLDMRMDIQSRTTAASLLNHRSAEELAEIFRQYGEQDNAWRIAQAVVERRQSRPWERTRDFAELVERVAGGGKRRSLPAATQCFMALRIAVNEELDELRTALGQARELLSDGGRLVVIAFHSLEDRIVKHFFRDEAAPCVCPADFPVCVCGKTPGLRILTRKPVRPSSSEIASNPRAASARLRSAEKPMRAKPLGNNGRMDKVFSP